MRTLCILIVTLLTLCAADAQQLLFGRRIVAASGGGGGVPAGQTWTVVTTNQNNGSSATPSILVPAGNVGDLIVAFLKWESTATINYITNGNNGLMTQRGSTVSHGSVDLKSAVATIVATGTGAENVTFNMSATASFADLTIYRCRPASGTISVDDTDGSSGTGTSVSFGSITAATTNSLTLFQIGPDGSSTQSSQSIGGNAATATLAVTGASTVGGWRIETTRVNGAAFTATLGTSRNWVGHTISVSAQ